MIQLNSKIIDNMCNTSNNTFYFSLTLSLILLILILVSLNNLEKAKCDCVNIPQKRFLKEWFTFVIIVQSLLALFFMIGSEPCYVRYVNNYYLYPVTMIISIINLIMLIRLIMYIKILRQNCPCGYGNLEKFLFWYLIIIFSIVALFILLTLLMAIITFFMVMGKK